MIKKPKELEKRADLIAQLREIGEKPTCFDCSHFVTHNGFCAQYQQKIPPEFIEVYDNNCHDFIQDIPF